MKKCTRSLFFLFMFIMLSVAVRTQNSLTHNTGPLEVTVIDNGYIGDDTTHTYGGVVFNGNPNALFIAGFIFGQYGQGYGNFYRILSDFYNLEPLAGFYSIPHFDQCTNYTAGLTLDPYFRTRVESFSNTGHDFIFLRINISNITSYIDDLYPGMFADWDVGNSALNRGGYDLSRNLFYTYESGGNIDTSFYGIMGIAAEGVPMAPNSMKGIVTDSVAWNRLEVYQFMTSTAFDTITTDGDYRTFICTGPFIINAAETLSVDIAIVAGTSLPDLLANADEAILYGQNIPVGISEDNPLPINYMLSQNYPNPFNTGTTIEFSLPEYAKDVRLSIYNILGEKVAELINGAMLAGKYEYKWNAKDFASGMYIYELRTEKFIAIKKMIMLK